MINAEVLPGIPLEFSFGTPSEFPSFIPLRTAAKIPPGVFIRLASRSSFCDFFQEFILEFLQEFQGFLLREFCRKLFQIFSKNSFQCFSWNYLLFFFFSENAAEIISRIWSSIIPGMSPRFLQEFLLGYHVIFSQSFTLEILSRIISG